MGLPLISVTCHVAAGVKRCLPLCCWLLTHPCFGLPSFIDVFSCLAQRGGLLFLSLTRTAVTVEDAGRGRQSAAANIRLRRVFRGSQQVQKKTFQTLFDLDFLQQGGKRAAETKLKQNCCSSHGGNGVVSLMRCKKSSCRTRGKQCQGSSLLLAS